jgi:hypothetical protein
MATKAPMLDMFNRVLPALDTRNKKLYENLSEEEQKGFSPWLVQRYLSSAESANNAVIEHYLIMTNDIVNVNFSEVKDPEMTWKLMSMVGIGKSLKHPYIAPSGGKRKKKNAFRAWLREQYPHLDDQELDIWISNLDKKSAKDMLEQYHVKDKDVISSANDL